jgi:hypothetical protein
MRDFYFSVLLVSFKAQYFPLHQTKLTFQKVFRAFHKVFEISCTICSNFDYQSNYEKIKHHNSNLTDGGHYQGGSEHLIRGMKVFYNKVTNRSTNRWIYTFPTGESINAWNDSVDETLSNVNTAKSMTVGMVSTLVPITKVPLAVMFAGSIGLADNKLLALVAMEGGLNRGDKLVIEATYETFRSTSGSENGYKTTLTIKIEDQNFNEIEILIRDTIEKKLDIFGNSNFNKAEDKLLRIIEDFNNSEIDISCDDVSSAPLIVKFKRRD